MMMRRRGMALLFGLATMWLVGCNKPCATTSECDTGDVCTAAICRALTCQEAMFARDPKSGSCVALSGCFLTDEQRTWQTCQEDPCAGLAENSCISDARCQATYAAPDVSVSRDANGTAPVASDSFCGGGVGVPPVSPNGPDGIVTATGVNNGTQPKHGGFQASTSCIQGNSRKYAGCRAAPQVTPQTACTKLTTAQCGARKDCSTSPNPGNGNSVGDVVAPGIDLPFNGGLGQCFDLHPRQASCDFADEMSCLTNPSCQAIGAKCYCPPGVSCECTGGSFLGCETNDRLRRCSTSAECGAAERCDNDEACIMPRTFTATPVAPSGPGAAGCLGACVPKGCAGMGEQQCNASPSCNAGSYGTVCHPKPYCVGNSPDGGGVITTVNAEGGDGGGTGNTCGCDSEFTGCADQGPIMNLRADRSLLVRDAEIIDDPAFSLLAVLTKLAPAGQVDAFAQSLLSQVGAAKQVTSGATTKVRAGFARFYPTLNGPSNLAKNFATNMATTALINRLDLASASNCGEARLSFAMTSAYQNGNQRMTMIVELKVPDDGNGCKTVAQSWAELSALDDVAQRRTRLIALYDNLLKPASVGQIRTNEFVNFTGNEAWELREFHINPGTGMLDLVPVAQTVDPKQVGSAALLSWINGNAAGLKAGTAIIPAQFLAGSSTEDGARLNFAAVSSDAKVLASEKPVNALACAGCHLTETKSPFVHIGERLATKVSGSFRPTGRAVIDDFMQKELVSRAALLNEVLKGTHTRALVAMDWRPLVQARVH